MVVSCSQNVQERFMLIEEQESHHPNLTLRVHRALSWLNRAEQADDVD